MDNDTVTVAPAVELAKPEEKKPNGSKDLMRLSIEMHCWGISSGVPVPEAQQREVVTDKADPTRLSLTNKKLIKCKEYSAIRSCDATFRSDLKRMSLASPRRSSTFVVPMGLVPRVYQRMDEYLKDRQELVDKFVDEAYDKAVAEAKTSDPLFRENNFPPKEEVRKTFWFDYDWETEDAPEAMKRLSAAAYERERKRVAERLADVKTEGVTALRGAFQEILTTLLDKFTAPETDDEGKAKTKALRTSTINRTLDFCDTFDQLNLAGDGELAALVTQFRDLTDGKDLSKMKKDPDLRKQAEPLLKQLKAKADELVQNVPTRRVSFDD